MSYQKIDSRKNKAIAWLLAAGMLLSMLAAAPRVYAASDWGEIQGSAVGSASYTSKYGKTTGLNDGVAENRDTSVKWTNYNADNAEDVIYDSWVQYDFDRQYEINAVQIAWHDDGKGSRLPGAIKIEYWDGANFAEVPRDAGNDTFTGGNDVFDTYSFTKSVTADKLRITIDNRANNAAVTILEWKVTGRVPLEKIEGTGEIQKNAVGSASYTSKYGTTTGLNDGVAVNQSGAKWTNYNENNEDDVFYDSWVQYDFDQTYSVRSMKIAWHDDGKGTRLPGAIKVEYWDGTKFAEVPRDASNDTFTGGNDTYDTYSFTRGVTTDKLRMTIDNHLNSASVTILEWVVMGKELAPSGEIQDSAMGSASYTSEYGTLTGLNDGVAKNIDKTVKWTNYKKDDVQYDSWVQYDFDQSYAIGSMQVSWHDDGAGTRLPGAIKVEYWNGTAFAEVPRDASKDTFTGGNDVFDTYTFTKAVTTDKLRMTIDNHLNSASVTILEWKVMEATDSTVKVSAITVSAEADSISEKNGTLQMTAEVKPDDADNKTVLWSVDNTTAAAIDSSTGLLTALSDGTVVVTATAQDGSGVEGTKTIEISGQADSADAVITTGSAYGIVTLLNNSEGYESTNTLVLTPREVTQGKRLVYQDGNTTYQLYYSNLLNAYVGLVPKSITVSDVRKNVAEVDASSTIPSVKYGVIGTGWTNRSSIGFEDLYFFDKIALIDGTVPTDGIAHVLAMDVNSDFELTPRDLTKLIRNYVLDEPFAKEAVSN